MPWQTFTSPLETWSTLPSFVVGQPLFIVGAIVALIHAKKRGRTHLLIWAGALIAGTANDLIFIALPLVDNFWHAQANVMLSARLPLYIPCVYICFIYYPVVAVRRLGLPVWAQAGLTGIVAVMFYAPYDITGAKFLWWTWHDTDLTVARRILGAPASSTLWVLTFTATFAWLVDTILTHDPEVSGRTFAGGLAVLAVSTTLLMVLQITLLQQLDGGAPGYGALAVGVAVYAALTLRGIGAADREKQFARAHASDQLLLGWVVAYFAVFVLIMAAFDPATHESTGVHQPIGECYVEAKDITGLTRHLRLGLCGSPCERRLVHRVRPPPPELRAVDDCSVGDRCRRRRDVLGVTWPSLEVETAIRRRTR